jgi:HSP20 family protein
MLPTITRRSYRPFYMPNLFDEVFSPLRSNTNGATPAVNVKEDEKNYFLEFALPGVNKNDLKIDVNEDVLTISSEPKNESEESKNGYTRKEFSYASFSRSFYVPENVTREKIEANYKDGILSVTLPKQEEEKNNISRKIEIS